MAITQLILFPAPYLPTDSAAFWFMMQIGMVTGFAATYPVNWWLIRRASKTSCDGPAPNYAGARCRCCR
jgi:hypothetical protein